MVVRRGVWVTLGAVLFLAIALVVAAACTPRQQEIPKHIDESEHRDAILELHDRGVIDDLEAFQPKDPASRLTVVDWLFKLTDPAPSTPDEDNFSDVEAGGPANWAHGQGIAQGFDDGSFRPQADSSRGQTASFLYRAEGSPEVEDTEAFPDVRRGPHLESIAWAEQTERIRGYPNGRFYSEKPVSQGQLASMLVRGEG
jgi:hypothetical protein